VGDPIVETGSQCRTVALLAVPAGVGNGFDLPGFLDRFDDDGWGLVCYGPTVQDDPESPVFDMAAIRANRVVPTLILDPDNFGPPRTLYEAAAEGWGASSFSPHPDPCDCQP